MPNAAARANKIQAFDSTGLNPIYVLPGTGTASEVLINFAGAGAGKNVDLINYSPEVPYTSGLGKELGLVINLDTWPGVFPNSSTDSGPGIRTAMATGRPLIWNSLYTVGPDPASPLASGFRTYALKAPTGSRWIMQHGAVIKQASGATSWMRTVDMSAVNDVQVYGEIVIDANVENASVTTNEHMHGLFIYNSKEIYIDAVNSYSARGDNILVGGDTDVLYSDHIHIGRVRAKKAGRKNLTISLADNSSFGDCDLDNSTGGAAIYAGGIADSTDKHSIDIEPDVAALTRKFKISFGHVKTYGLGNDFTAGTTPADADNYLVNMTSFTSQISGSSSLVKSLQSNAITITVAGDLKVLDCAGTDRSIEIGYAARISAANMKFTGSTLTAGGSLCYWHLAGGNANTPNITTGRLEVFNSVGIGIESLSCNVNAQVVETSCPNANGLLIAENVTTIEDGTAWVVNHLILRNTGVPTTGAGVKLFHNGITGVRFTCNELSHYDTRGTKAGYAFETAQNDSRNLCINSVFSPYFIPLVNYLGTDKYHRVCGSSYQNTGSTTPGHYVGFGTPEGMVLAAIGSTYSRTDGGAGTSFYVKQAGVSNTGWVAK
jgi:hypothetical protein